MTEMPKAFDHEAEGDKFLARVKKKAANKFSFTRQAPLQSATELAYWLHVYYRDAEAEEVCRFLGQAEFTGNFNLWSPVEGALTLLSRLLRREGREDEAQECLERIKAAGYQSSRLEGFLLERQNGYRSGIEEAVKTGDKTAERAYRIFALKELCFVMELGGSDKLSVAAAEQEFQANLAALRALQKVATPS